MKELQDTPASAAGSEPPRRKPLRVIGEIILPRSTDPNVNETEWKMSMRAYEHALGHFIDKRLRTDKARKYWEELVRQGYAEKDFMPGRYHWLGTLKALGYMVLFAAPRLDLLVKDTGHDGDIEWKPFQRLFLVPDAKWRQARNAVAKKELEKIKKFPYDTKYRDYQKMKEIFT